MGTLVQTTRKELKLTQKDLAASSGVGIRFLRELEQGKPTCQLGKVLTILTMLGIRVDLQTSGGRFS